MLICLIEGRKTAPLSPSSLSLSLSLSLLGGGGGERPLRPPLEPPLEAYILC